MDNKINLPIQYQIGNTTFTVSPVYGELATKEALEEKIKRLILTDKERKDGQP